MSPKVHRWTALFCISLQRSKNVKTCYLTFSRSLHFLASIIRGPERIRTAVAAFAELSLATRPQDLLFIVAEKERLFCEGHKSNKNRETNSSGDSTRKGRKNRISTDFLISVSISLFRPSAFYFLCRDLHAYVCNRTIHRRIDFRYPHQE